MEFFLILCNCLSDLSSELAFRAGGFPYSVEHMAGEGQPAQAARPNIIRAYGACAVCQCVLVRIYGGVFVRDSGRSLKVFLLHPQYKIYFFAVIR